MSDCPMCGMNCGDTCYRPSSDVKAFKIDKEAELKSRIVEFENLLDELWKMDNLNEMRNKIRAFSKEKSVNNKDNISEALAKEIANNDCL